MRSSPAGYSPDLIIVSWQVGHIAGSSARLLELEGLFDCFMTSRKVLREEKRSNNEKYSVKRKILAFNRHSRFMCRSKTLFQHAGKAATFGVAPYQHAVEQGTTKRKAADSGAQRLGSFGKCFSKDGGNLL